MSQGKHKTNKPTNDPTYDKRWSGVSYASHCSYGCACSDGHYEEPLHLEGHDSHYCPICDDFKAKRITCKNG